MNANRILPLLLPILLSLIAILHLLPAIGAWSDDWLLRLYGVRIDDDNLSVLLRHRGMLFGLIGGVILYTAWRPDLHTLALLLSGLSMVGFVVLAWPCERCYAQIGSVMRADLIGLAVWLLAALLHASALWKRRRR